MPHLAHHPTTSAAAVHEALEIKEAVFDQDQDLPESPTSTALAKAVDADLLARCRGLIEHGHKGQRWSRNQLARAMGTNSANVSIYLTQGTNDSKEIKFAVPAFEAKLRDFLHNLSQKRNFDNGVIETAIVKIFRGFVENVRATREIGFLYGPAGLGKTTALEHLGGKIPNGLTVRATRWSCGAHGVEYQLATALRQTSPPRGTRRGDAIRARLAEMDSAIILVDNAHRLTRRAVEYLFDLHDESSTPLVLTGNRSFIDRLRSDDQLFSRVFQCREVAFPEDPDKAAHHHLNLAADAIMRRELPDHWQQVKQAGRKVAQQKGHLRALEKHCRAAAEIAALPGYAQRSMLEAFQAAHANSVHTNYPLDEE